MFVQRGLTSKSKQPIGSKIRFVFYNEFIRDSGRWAAWQTGVGNCLPVFQMPDPGIKKLILNCDILQNIKLVFKTIST